MIGTSAKPKKDDQIELIIEVTRAAPDARKAPLKCLSLTQKEHSLYIDYS